MKTNFIIIFLFLITSSAYARSKFCPEAELSEEQTAQVKELRKNVKANTEGLSKEEKRAAWVDLQQSILDIATSEEQKLLFLYALRAENIREAVLKRDFLKSKQLK